MNNQDLSIGTVAQAAHISVDAVRYYERTGLIPRALRRPSGYRKFSPDIVDRIRLVKSLQRFGLTLSDIRNLLQAIDSGERTWGSLRQNFHSVLDRLDCQLVELRKVQKRLRRMLRYCDEGRCPFLQSVSSES